MKLTILLVVLAAVVHVALGIPIWQHKGSSLHLTGPPRAPSGGIFGPPRSPGFGGGIRFTHRFRRQAPFKLEKGGLTLWSKGGSKLQLTGAPKIPPSNVGPPRPSGFGAGLQFTHRFGKK